MTPTTKAVVGAVAVLVTLCFGFPFIFFELDSTPALPQRNEQPIPPEKQEIGGVSENEREPSSETPDLNKTRYFLTTLEQQHRISRQNRAIDPSQDGWETEELASRAHSILENLLTFSIHENGSSSQVLGQPLANDFSCTPLLPQQLSTVFQDATVATSRGDPQILSQTPPGLRGASGFRRAMDELLKSLRSSENDPVRVQLKVHQIAVQEPMMATNIHLELGSVQSGTANEIHAVWQCLWHIEASGDLRLSAIRLRDYEQSKAAQGSIVWFSDCTQAVLASNPSFSDQLIFGLDYWLKRIELSHRMHVFAANGLAIGDTNGDGLDDLYICQPGGLPNRLFVQNVDGTASDLSSRARVNWLDATSSALFVDLDNDHDQDLIAATLSGIIVMANDSTGRFQYKGVLPTSGADMQSLTAVDYDNDGDLDIYVCLNFQKATANPGEVNSSFVYHDANDGAANRLFRNDIVSDGEWQFADVTRSTGLDQDNRRHSLAAAWEDFDNDGDQDLYVANDYGRNCLYRNDQGKFVNIARDAGVVDFGSGMSVSWADFNHDGHMDLYVGNMYSSAGNRITAQQAFRPNESDLVRNVLRRFAKGNSLFANLGNGRFREISAPAAVEHARWAWSSVFVDVNNNGWEDLMVANGYITANDTEDL